MWILGFLSEFPDGLRLQVALRVHGDLVARRQGLTGREPQKDEVCECRNRGLL